MNVRRSKRFIVRFRRLSDTNKKSVIETIEAFRDNPLPPSLANDALHGTMTGKRAISADHDLRIVFTVKGDYDEVTFLDIGTHIEVYRE